jgi:hypothetical protein
MSGFADVRAEIAGKLAAAEVVATLDPRAQVPCVLVDLPRVTGSQGIGGWTVEVPIMILAPPPGDADAATWMLDELEPVMTVYPGALADPRTVNHAGGDCPAYVVTVTATVPNPNC